MPEKQLSVTIGITTCYGSDDLIGTVRSIKEMGGLTQFRCILIADSIPLNANTLKALNALGVEITENTTPSGQLEKQRQILSMTTSDILIFIEDDVRLEKNSLAKAVSLFATDPSVTLVSLRSQPLKAETLFESAITVGTTIAQRVAQNWNQGDNFLSVDGRCMLLRTSFLKEITLPDGIVSSDAYLYLANKQHGGKFRYLTDGCVFFRNPQHMCEHRRKSSRFQHIHLEMNRYFQNCDQELEAPNSLLMHELITEATVKPIATVLYLGIALYTRLFTLTPRESLTTLWRVDTSTKQIGQQ